MYAIYWSVAIPVNIIVKIDHVHWECQILADQSFWHRVSSVVRLSRYEKKKHTQYTLQQANVHTDINRVCYFIHCLLKIWLTGCLIISVIAFSLKFIHSFVFCIIVIAIQTGGVAIARLLHFARTHNIFLFCFSINTERERENEKKWLKRAKETT